MYECGDNCPYKTYKQFYEYYGSFTYADDWVLAALESTTVTYTGNYAGAVPVTFEFAKYSDRARIEAAQKGTAYMNVWMYVIREYEDAIDDCEKSCGQSGDCNEFSDNDAGPVDAWDEGVAFYAGSLEGEAQGGSSDGQLVYRLAEKRCANFGTCTLSLALAPAPGPQP